MLFVGSAEVEVVKKSYTKLSDAYGCLGVLLVNSSKDEIVYLLTIITVTF